MKNRDIYYINRNDLIKENLEIEKEIAEEKEKENYDAITKLRLKQLNKALLAQIIYPNKIF